MNLRMIEGISITTTFDILYRYKRIKATCMKTSADSTWSCKAIYMSIPSVWHNSISLLRTFLLIFSAKLAIIGYKTLENIYFPIIIWCISHFY